MSSASPGPRSRFSPSTRAVRVPSRISKCSSWDGWKWGGGGFPSAVQAPSTSRSSGELFRMMTVSPGVSLSVSAITRSFAHHVERRLEARPDPQGLRSLPNQDLQSLDDRRSPPSRLLDQPGLGAVVDQIDQDDGGIEPLGIEWELLEGILLPHSNHGAVDDHLVAVRARLLHAHRGEQALGASGGPGATPVADELPRPP